MLIDPVDDGVVAVDTDLRDRHDRGDAPEVVVDAAAIAEVEVDRVVDGSGGGKIEAGKSAPRFFRISRPGRETLERPRSVI